ncbi:hypothetical protein ACFPRL_30300 [Pseudoclavibacter helvolus]
MTAELRHRLDHRESVPGRAVLLLASHALNHACPSWCSRRPRASPDTSPRPTSGSSA